MKAPAAGLGLPNYGTVAARRDSRAADLSSARAANFQFWGEFSAISAAARDTKEQAKRR
jgi:hypothetical protein